VRKILTWAAGAAGGLAAVKALRRQAEAQPATAPDERAEELRTKLEQARAADEELPQAAADDPDARRDRVHEEARAALDEMGRD
jgi:hypothetical protein